MSSDVELIEATRQGDLDAFAELFARHHAMAVRYAAALSNDETLAGDLVSESYSRMLSLLQRGLGPSTSFKSYLLTTVKNVHIDHVRKLNRESLTEDYGDVPATAISIRDEADSWAESSAIADAFRSLPDQWRQALWYTEVLGESLGEAAQHLGSNANALGVLRFRAREGLRQAYLAAHLDSALDQTCRDLAPALTQYVRGKASPSNAARFESHLEGCGHCQRAVSVASQINTNLGAVLGPAVIAAVGAETVRRSGVMAALFSKPSVIAGVGATLAGAVGLTLVLLPAGDPTGDSVEIRPPITTQSVVRGGVLLPRSPSPSQASSPVVPPVSEPGVTPPPVTDPTSAPTPAPTPAPPPAPTQTPRAPGLALAQPRATAVRSGQTGQGQVLALAAPADRVLQLRVTLQNATDYVVRSGGDVWTCVREGAPAGSVVLICTSKPQASSDQVSLSLSASLADPAQAFSGLLVLTDGTTTESKRFSVAAS